MHLEQIAASLADFLTFIDTVGWDAVGLHVQAVAHSTRRKISSGFVVATTVQAGCFVRLRHDLTGRCLLKDLSDDFVASPAGAFPPGMLVAAKVVDVTFDPKKGTSFVSLNMRPSALLQSEKTSAGSPIDAFGDIRVGDEISGAVVRVESFGIFVKLQGAFSDITGLAHITECADWKVDDLSRSFSSGDLVKAKVLRVNTLKRQLSLGLKPSYFERDRSTSFSTSESDNDNDAEDDGRSGGEFIDDGVEVGDDIKTYKPISGAGEEELRGTHTNKIASTKNRRFEKALGLNSMADLFHGAEEVLEAPALKTGFDKNRSGESGAFHWDEFQFNGTPVEILGSAVKSRTQGKFEASQLSLTQGAKVESEKMSPKVAKRKAAEEDILALRREEVDVVQKHSKKSRYAGDDGWSDVSVLTNLTSRSGCYAKSNLFAPTLINMNRLIYRIIRPILSGRSL